MFITFEGPDFAGKSTAIEKIQEYLMKKNINFVFTREPGGFASEETKILREIILSPKFQNISPMAEAILFAADRRINLENNIWPALKNNKLVLADRYIDSSLVYQGWAKKAGFDKVLELQKNISDNTFPDITIYFQISLEHIQQRIEDKGIKEQNMDRFEKEGLPFYRKVIEGYDYCSTKFKSRFRIVDATLSIDEVFEQVKKIFDNEILDSL